MTYFGQFPDDPYYMTGDEEAALEESRRAEQWAVVGQVFDDGRSCVRCPFGSVVREGYGETLRYCGLLQTKARHDPTECPGFHLEIDE